MDGQQPGSEAPAKPRRTRWLLSVLIGAGVAALLVIGASVALVVEVDPTYGARCDASLDDYLDRPCVSAAIDGVAPASNLEESGSWSASVVLPDAPSAPVACRVAQSTPPGPRRLSFEVDLGNKPPEAPAVDRAALAARRLAEAVLNRCGNGGEVLTCQRCDASGCRYE